MSYLSDVSDMFLQSISSVNNEKILSSKYYNKQITTRDNGYVHSHDQEESKLNNIITAKQ